MRIRSLSLTTPTESEPPHEAKPSVSRRDTFTKPTISLRRQHSPLPIDDRAQITTLQSTLEPDQFLIILFTETDNDNNKTYDPYFTKQARHSRGGKQIYARTENPELAREFGIRSTPAILILNDSHPAYLVKDPMALDREISYAKMSPEARLADIEKHLRTRDLAERGRTLIAYGKTALELSDQASIDHAASVIRGFFKDNFLEISDTALFCYRPLCKNVSAQEASLAARELTPLFDALPEIAFAAIDVFSELKGKVDGASALPALDSLLKYGGSLDPDIASSALVALGDHAGIMPKPYATATAQNIKIHLASQNHFIRWSALYAYGEMAAVFDQQEFEQVPGIISAFMMRDSYTGARHRAIIIADQVIQRFTPDQKGTLAPALRSVIENPAEQIVVLESAVALYVKIAPELPREEIERGIKSMQMLAVDPEYEKIRLMGLTALEKLQPLIASAH